MTSATRLRRGAGRNLTVSITRSPSAAPKAWGGRNIDHSLSLRRAEGVGRVARSAGWGRAVLAHARRCYQERTPPPPFRRTLPALRGGRNIDHSLSLRRAEGVGRVARSAGWGRAVLAHARRFYRERTPPPPFRRTLPALRGGRNIDHSLSLRHAEGVGRVARSAGWGRAVLAHARRCYRERTPPSSKRAFSAMASCLALAVSRIGRLGVEIIMAWYRAEAIQPVCPRTREDLRIGSIIVWVRQCGSVDMGLFWPSLRPKVEPCAAYRTEPSKRPRTALEMFDLPVPLKLLLNHAQESCKGRGSCALTIGAVTDKVAQGFARICPRHRSAHAVA